MQACIIVLMGPIRGFQETLEQMCTVGDSEAAYVAEGMPHKIKIEKGWAQVNLCQDIVQSFS